jgi:hypothetical protein
VLESLNRSCHIKAAQNALYSFCWSVIYIQVIYRIALTKSLGDLIDSTSWLEKLDALCLQLFGEKRETYYVNLGEKIS